MIFQADHPHLRNEYQKGAAGDFQPRSSNIFNTPSFFLTQNETSTVLLASCIILYYIKNIKIYHSHILDNNSTKLKNKSYRQQVTYQ